MLMSTFRVLEFYCGVGGLRYSLEESGVDAIVVEAFDINDVGNDVYEHNFGHRPNQANIQGLSVRQLDEYKADAWLLSPPCQPYTRQGCRSKKDASDTRAVSFLKLLEMLPLLSSPPSHLLVENVVGFETSATHGRLLAVMKDAGFSTQEFILSPLQFGIPYSRPRYFCLAKRAPCSFRDSHCNGMLLCEPGPVLERSTSLSRSRVGEDCGHDAAQSRYRTVDGENKKSRSQRNEPYIDPTSQCRPICEFLETTPKYLEESSEELIDTINNHDADKSLANLESSSNLNSTVEKPCRGVYGEDPFSAYRVPLNVVERWVDAYDVVTPDSTRCCCFTKSYTRYAKGTGSFLATRVSIPEGSDISPEEFISNLRCNGHSMAGLQMRYFTPREVANFHSLPVSFAFPVHITLKQRYALLGNSLSVAVVGESSQLPIRYVIECKYLYDLRHFYVTESAFRKGIIMYFDLSRQSQLVKLSKPADMMWSV